MAYQSLLGLSVRDGTGLEMSLPRYHYLSITRPQRVHISNDHLAGAVTAELRFVSSADYGECAEDVLGIIVGDAVEEEVECV